MEIRHLALENGWNSNEILQNANKLILGSFNPFMNNGENADYYYGRRTNYFWRIMAEIEDLNPEYYLNNLDLKLECMNRFGFCFLDLISSINITCQGNDEAIIERFVRRKIYKEFSDQVLFTTSTKFESKKLNVSRVYNQDVLDLIQQGNIRKVIHTLGNNTIDLGFGTKPKEKNLGVDGFQGFVNQIVNQNNAVVISESYSPSGRAVKGGGSNYLNELKQWLRVHIVE